MASESKVVWHALVVAGVNRTPLRAIRPLRTRRHTRTSFQLGRKHESAAHAMRYTYQTLTAKPFFMADSAVSVMELINAGHAVAEPHVVEL